MTARHSARAGVAVGGVARSRGECEAIFHSPSFMPPLPGLGSTRESSTSPPPPPVQAERRALTWRGSHSMRHLNRMGADFDLVFSKRFLKLKFKAFRHTFWGILGS